MNQSPIDPAEGQHLRRSLGLWSVTVSGVGVVLGAGIYVLVGEAAGEAGDATWMAFLIAGLLAAFTGLSFAELAAMYPEAGASAAYAEEAFGPRTGFVTGWLDVTVNVVGAAAVALGFAGYASDLLGGDPRWIGVGLIVLTSAIVYIGVRETVMLAVVFALLEVAGLVIVIAVGLPDLAMPSFEVPRGAAGVLAAAALVFFAYEGFEEIVSLSEETRHPTRTIPRALVIAIGVTSAIYVLVAATAVSVVDWEELAVAEAPLALVARVAGDDRLADALSTVALFATFNTVLLLLATGSRVTYGMSRRGLLPAGLGRLSPRQTPWIATLGLAGLAIAFVFTGDIGYVAQVTNFAVFGQFLVVNAAVIWLRRARPEADRPFRIPGSWGGVPWTAATGIGGTLLLAFFMDRTAFITGGIALALGVLLSFPALRPRAATPSREDGPVE
ncbi:MAG: APC family permease [Dehalococcoidia bacterium]|nr:APC family permease [Dehalococcoidia bacterium]